MMGVTLTNVSVYCTASTYTLLQWRVKSTDPPSIMFLEFFCENYLINNGNTCSPAVELAAWHNLQGLEKPAKFLRTAENKVQALQISLMKEMDTRPFLHMWEGLGMWRVEKKYRLRMRLSGKLIDYGYDCQTNISVEK